MSPRGYVSRTRIASALALAVCFILIVSPTPARAQSSEGQARPPLSSGPAALEFPVTMRQNVVAGKTAVGTKVEARLTMATLVKGTVIPEGAIFSGEVVKSAAKSDADPSQLSIRMDSVQWKNESRPMKVFLTAWYYPLLMGEEAETKDQEEIMSSPSGNSFPSQRIPRDKLPSVARVSENRVLLKDIESKRADDGTITLTSTKSSIKLDKGTMYVLSPGDLGAHPPAKPDSH